MFTPYPDRPTVAGSNSNNSQKASAKRALTDNHESGNRWGCDILLTVRSKKKTRLCIDVDEVFHVQLACIRGLQFALNRMKTVLTLDAVIHMEIVVVLFWYCLHSDSDDYKYVICKNKNKKQQKK